MAWFTAKKPESEKAKIAKELAIATSPESNEAALARLVHPYMIKDRIKVLNAVARNKNTNWPTLSILGSIATMLPDFELALNVLRNVNVHEFTVIEISDGVARLKDTDYFKRNIVSLGPICKAIEERVEKLTQPAIDVQYRVLNEHLRT